MTNDNHIRSGFQIGMAAGLALAAAFAGAGCMAPDAAADPTVSTSARVRIMPPDECWVRNYLHPRRDAGRRTPDGGFIASFLVDSI